MNANGTPPSDAVPSVPSTYEPKDDVVTQSEVRINFDIAVLSAVLGWSNPETGPENTRLYALDQGPSPRWAKPHGRVVEQALREAGAHHEGDRYLVVRLGDRFLSDDAMEQAVRRIFAAFAPAAGGAS